MYKVQIVSKDDPNVSYKIYVHSSLVADWDSNVQGADYEKVVWKNGKFVSKCIDGEETKLVDISAEVLNDMRGDDYQICTMSLEFDYALRIYVTRRCLVLCVTFYNKATNHYKSNAYKLLENSVQRYIKLKQKYQRLKQELLHERFRPGGSGYEEAKKDFEEKCIH